MVNPFGEDNSLVGAVGPGSGGASQTIFFEDPREVYTSEKYSDLLAAIIRSGLQLEGVAYLETPGGKFWCWVGDLDPGAVGRQAANSRRLPPGTIEETRHGPTREFHR